MPLASRPALSLRPAFCRLLILLASLLLTACTKEPPQLQPLAADAVVLAFGDSLTYGTGAGQEYSYPALLAEQTGLTVINAGVPGELSAAGRKRLPALLQRYQPDLVLLCHGGNDLLRQRDPATTAANLRAMIDLARDAGAEVLLIAVPEPGLFPQAADFYAEVASATGVPLLEGALAAILSEPSLKADVVHPNRAGYRKLSAAIVGKLQQAGAF